ncbi:hypothetical protein KBD13_01125 [Patescibacteria group bacterium]|jgi:hypothetical protein|nr:hypothetical protein [Patescibacteria group bacterium]
MPTSRTNSRRPTTKRTASSRRASSRASSVDKRDRLVTQELRALYGSTDREQVSRLAMPERGRWLRTISWIGVGFMGFSVLVAVLLPFIARVISEPSVLLLRLGE